MRCGLGIALSALICAVSAAPAPAAPATTLSVTSGPPTTSVTVTGSGFDPSARVDVFFDTTDLAVATSSAAGAVSIPVQVPSSAQPGQHWLTLDQTSSHTAAQASFTVQSSWAAAGFTASHRSYNPYENTIDASNASQLLHAWTGVWSGSGWVVTTPVLAYKGSEFVADQNGNVRAFSQSGKLLWTAATNHSMNAVSGVATGTTVAFGDSLGFVYGYKYNCRTDGGVCTPLWTQSVGSNVTSGLTAFNGAIYAPSTDATFHVLNATTGAPVTTINAVGAPVTPISFAPDGSYFWAYNAGGGSVGVQEIRPAGGSSGGGTTTGISPLAVYNDVGFYTSADGHLRTFGYPRSWVATTSGTNCTPAPAIADDVVYAGGCSTLGAYDAGTGSVKWIVTTPGIYGVTVANGVVYTCEPGNVYGQIAAYDAANGSKVWDGGSCYNIAPTVVNGTVYTYWNGLEAYNLTSAGTASKHRLHVRRPDPRRLKPNRRLHRTS